MVDVANLNIRVGSQQAGQATDRLDALALSGANVDRIIDQLAQSSRTTERAFDRLSAQTSELIAESRTANTVLGRIDTTLTEVNLSSRASAASLANMELALAGVATNSSTAALSLLQLNAASVTTNSLLERIANNLDDGTNALDTFDRHTDAATISGNQFARTITLMTAALGGLLAAGLAFSSFVRITREFEVLESSLLTATGGAEEAGQAFIALQDFASATPFSLQETTEAFIKLTNLGLNPSEAAIESYGNTASAVGRSLGDFVLAVANATTGEFESLKTFGIKAINEGDKIAFRFQGSTTRVGNNAKEIEGFLRSIGENQFAGALEERSKTLDGALSNLGDAFEKLTFTISQTGLSDAFADTVRDISDAFENLSASITSGQLGTSLDALFARFDVLAHSGEEIVSSLSDTLGVDLPNLFVGLGANTAAVFSKIGEEILRFPLNFTTLVRLLSVELGNINTQFLVFQARQRANFATLVDIVFEFGAQYKRILGARFDEIVDSAVAYGKAIAQGLNPFENGEFDLDAELAKIGKTSKAIRDDAQRVADFNIEQSRRERDARIEQLENISKASSNTRKEILSEIINERDATLDSIEQQIKAADKLRQQFDFLAQSRAAFRVLEGIGITTEDLGRGEALAITYQGVTTEIEKSREALEGFLRGIDGAPPKIQKIIDAVLEGGDAVKKLDSGFLGRFQIEGEEGLSSSVIKERERNFENLKSSLRTEEEAIAESYEKRLEIIKQNTEAGSALQQDLLSRTQGDFAISALGDFLPQSRQGLESALPSFDFSKSDKALEGKLEGNTFDDELTRLNEQFETRRQLILDATELTETQRTELEETLTMERNRRIEALEKGRTQSILSSSKDIFGSLTSIAKDFGGEQNKTYRALFAANKAFAVAQSVINIQTALGEAFKLGFPAGLAAAATVAAETAGIVSTIQGTNFSGAFNEGGRIPGGSVGLVGEFGPELVRGPATVTSRRETAEAFRSAQSGSEAKPPQVNVKNINVLDPSIVNQFLTTEEGEQMIMNIVQRNQQSIGF